MKLFRYEGYNIEIAPEALLLKPFKDIYDRDKSKDKFKAKQELGFVYFMEDPRSDYLYIVDRKDRAKEICAGEGMPDKWKADSLVEKACTFYKSFKTSSALLLDDERVYIDKLRDMLHKLDPSKTDKFGKLLTPLNQSSQLITMVNKAIIDINNAEKALYADLANSDKIRGSQEKAVFEDL